MAETEKAERITITLPPHMLASIKAGVEGGGYGSTSEVIREAIRVWQQREEERQARLEVIRARLEKSANSGTPVPIEEAFARIEAHHRERMSQTDNEAL